VDDDIVAVVGDENQGPDGSESSHESTESINFTVEGREHPHSTTERVVGEDWEVGQQHVQVKNSEVGDQKIGGCTQLLHFEVQIYYHSVTQEGEDTQEDVDHSQKVVPHGVHWGVVVPVRVDHVFDRRRRKVSYCDPRGVSETRHSVLLYPVRINRRNM